MKQLYPDLWQSNKYSSGSLSSHAYLLTHPDGNILFYNTNDAGDLDRIEQLGGIRYQLLTHRDEAGASLARIRERFGSGLLCSESESSAIGHYARPDRHFDAGDHQLGDLRVLHTPGHTDGSVCFLYHSPHGKTYLFTGDTFFQWQGHWATLVIAGAGGSKTTLAASLAKLRDLAPDVVMSSGFVGEVALVEPSPEQWTAAIDYEIARLTAAD